MEADSAPLSVARYRAERSVVSDEPAGEVWVAEDCGQLVGVGEFHPAWWTGDPTSYSLELRVDPLHERQGIGGRLFAQLAARLKDAGASRLLTWVRPDFPSGVRFAKARGFRPTGQEIREYRLHLPEATPEAYAGVEARLEREGIRIASLAELDSVDDSFLRALQRVWADSGEETPNTDDLRKSFFAWRRQVLDGPGLSAETHWVALDAGRPVGMTYLDRLSEDAAENDYTGVASTHRGRGIAPALKLRTLAWARDQGVRWFYTSSEVGNSPMVNINRRLGYRPGARRLEFTLALAARPKE